LLDDLDGEGNRRGIGQGVGRADGAFFGVCSPGHESAEFVLVGEGPVLVGLGVGATEDGRHFDRLCDAVSVSDQRVLSR
jgi:hypothetical protein